jgi:predicted RNase H-like nuclease (RuvC/YqgF family)
LKVKNFEDFLGVLENDSDLKSFQIASICEWVEGLQEQNEGLKREIASYFKVTQKIINNFSSFQLKQQNKDRCEESRGVCAAVQKEFEQLKTTLDDTQLDLKSA